MTGGARARVVWPSMRGGGAPAGKSLWCCATGAVALVSLLGAPCPRVVALQLLSGDVVGGDQRRRLQLLAAAVRTSRALAVARAHF